MTVHLLAKASRQGHSEEMMYWLDGYSGMGLFAGLMMIFFWLVIIAVGIFVARWFMGNRSSSASAILDERLARGEISIAEYHERKAALIQRKR